MRKPTPRTGRILKTGIIGAVVTAICCFTPALVVLLAYLGLSALLPFADMVLLPLLAVFVGLTAYGGWRWIRHG